MTLLVVPVMHALVLSRRVHTEASPSPAASSEAM